ncbi:hypothetical protein FQR65_LT14756 [Abscondita terminalis]|nr:hypothetical protein FQR65_LT14756 [Abscondita terminalis]
MNNSCWVLVFALVFVSGERGEDERIVGGQAAAISSYPYQVSLRSQSNSHFCGGSIISNNLVLTAAHCLTGRTAGTVAVVAGTNSISSGGTRYSVAELISHPSYNTGNNGQDIALIKIAGTFTYDANVRPVQLASSYPPVGANLTLTGWGLQSYPSNTLPNILQCVHLAAIDVEQCKSLLPGYPVTSTHLCTKSRKGQGACQGDSGGPLVYGNAQVGVVSWGIPCAKGYPDVFTSVPSYINWIITNARNARRR